MARLALAISFYTALGIFVFWLGLKLFALALLLFCIGGILNLIVMAVNGGRMPVRAVDEFIYERIIQSKDHCLMTEKTRLPWLADIFDWVFFIVSIGDVIITIGEIVFVIAWVVLFGRFFLWLFKIAWMLIF